MLSWTTWWAYAHRGMGLEKYNPKKVEIDIYNVPECSHIRFHFGTGYGSQVVIIKNAFYYVEETQEKYSITFDGKTSCQIKPQSTIVSDEQCIKIKSSYHSHLVYEIQTQEGYQCASGFKVPPTDHIKSKNGFVYLLKSIEIGGSSLKGCICVLGDSITEQGYWTEPLKKLLNNKGYTLLPLGISGNRLLRDLENVTLLEPLSSFKQLKGQTYVDIPLEKQCFGKAGIKRFKEDILSCHNIMGIIIAIGVNDLYQPGTFCANQTELPNVDEMLNGYLFLKELIGDIPTWVLGITPFLGEDRSVFFKEKIRCEINNGLKEKFKKVIIFDSWLMNENKQIRRVYHNGDYLHPNQKAGEKIAQSVFKKLEV